VLELAGGDRQDVDEVCHEVVQVAASFFGFVAEIVSERGLSAVVLVGRLGELVVNDEVIGKRVVLLGRLFRRIVDRVLGVVSFLVEVLRLVVRHVGGMLSARVEP
jgi:hypothetical protein